MSDQNHAPAPQDENQLIAERREKLKALREQVREQGGVAFPNDFKPADRAEALQQAHADKSAEQLDADFVLVLMEAYSLRADKVARYEEILDEYGSLADCPASWRIDVVSLSLETRHGVWVAQVPIRPKGISKKKRTIGVPEFRHYTDVQGRFTDLLPVKEGEGGPYGTLH